MREYLKKTLRQNVKIKENNDLYDRVIWMHEGRLMKIGDTEDVLMEYIEYMHQEE